MSHLALLENLPNSQDPTTWLEPVEDDSYARASQD